MQAEVNNMEIEIPIFEAKGLLLDALRDPLALSLSRHVAANLINLDHMFCKVFVQKGLPISEVLGFRSGGKANSSLADSWLDIVLEQYLSSYTSFVIAEDWTARPDDDFIVERSMPAHFFGGDEVYYFVDKESFQVINRRRRILSNTSPGFRAFVIKGKSEQVRQKVLTSDDLQQLSLQVLAAVVGVYDGESYAIFDFSRSRDD